MMWPFSRSEARADATVQIVNRAEAYASGKSLDPGALAIVEACASLWARCISSASVGPDVAALRGVDAPFLEMVGRSLAARGGFVAALKVEAGPCGWSRLQPGIYRETLTLQPGAIDVTLSGRPAR